MNEEFLTASEQLISFLDGELDTEQTSALFSELANNSELQKEMKDMVSIRNAFRNAQLTPPESLKHSILINTGMQKATFMNQIKAGAGLLAAFWALFTSKTATAIYLLAIGAGIWFAFQNEKDSVSINNNTAQNVISNANTDQLNNNSRSLNNISIANSSEIANNNTISSNNSIAKAKSIKVINSNSNSSLNTDITEMQKPIDILSDAKLTQSKNSSLTFAPKQNFWNIPGLDLYINPDFLNNLSININTFNGLSFPEQRLTNLNNPLLNNFSIGLMYDFKNNFSIGLEAGFENYAMQFEGYEGDILYQYMQNYNSAWGGIAIQYTFSPVIWLDETQPYLKTLIGANELGPVLKMAAGGKYYITPNFAFVGGLEFSSFLYQNSGNTFSTNKLGYTLGAMFGF